MRTRLIRLMAALWIGVMIQACPVPVQEEENLRPWPDYPDDDDFTPVDIDADQDGVTVGAGDCNDQDATTHPGASELCDGQDNNCDGLVPSNEQDQDEDGLAACEGDCDDHDAGIRPGQNEVCNGLDDNCDGALTPSEVDNDHDGQAPCEGDCDDQDGANFSGNGEVCDGQDNDCDGLIPSGEQDMDHDGQAPCEGDCNDQDASTFPGAPEVCNGVDNDCDGVVVEFATDLDDDGYMSCSINLAVTDCNDGDPTIHPGAIELCDGQDSNCDGINFEIDQDGDGVMFCDGDCNDANAAMYPGNVETCNGQDNDCNGIGNEVDNDGDGVMICAGDCDDTDPSVTALRTLYWDADGDGVGGNGAYIPNTCSAPGPSWVEVIGDCDDASQDVGPGFPELCDGQDMDNNCDGILPAGEQDMDGDGITFCGGDCAVLEAAQAPGNVEICDGLDNDCNGITPSSEQDSDGDGIRDCAESTIDYDQDGVTVGAGDCNDQDVTIHPNATELCNGQDDNCNAQVDEGMDQDGDGWSACNGDCDDTNAAIHPNATELCDGVDNNCDGVTPSNEVDADSDGFRICAGDCVDAVANIYPGAVEVCNALDDDCDGAVDEGWDQDGDSVTFCGDDGVYPSADDDCSDQDGLAWQFQVLYLDLDNDGRGDPSISLLLCGLPSGWSQIGNDCDAANASTFPGAPELCDGQDNDCNGTVPTNELDLDGDGVKLCAGDCNDIDAANFPGNVETCDGRDNNCDGIIPASETDQDGNGVMQCAEPNVNADADSYTVGQGDCDDNNAVMYPGNTEVCDSLDNDCDGSVDEGFDMDGDGQTTCQGDCDDSDSDVGLGFPELCDEVDNNCDGAIPANEQDLDSDGWATCDGDCNDSDGDNYPGNTEVYDGQDNDCDGAVDEGLLPTVPAGLVDLTFTTSSNCTELELYASVGSLNSFPPNVTTVAGSSTTLSVALPAGVHALRFNARCDGAYLFLGASPASAVIGIPNATLTVGGTPVPFDAGDAVWNGPLTGVDGLLLFNAVNMPAPN
ncbi:hypothetical protein COV06_02280 [Candidatus Uhrbacteria bacterium CG10_big_fil_rev_8_21_14_0_10_50_16]|uniref:Uncharacterized protein n=1 Tax=Candidatus Uhrbacteria bacterium CG10_big_fil_rev_8_21_14_0_10_50_16 TaxID=1975039 RepID=A0A2H0RMB3_9BACT|nr:MAG: hypothetical protein COV06_02280 [Candidatus Uhrbacteria bacterium CG10_big_fil_rev_8_21_14_0_10_50_16]